MSRMLIVVIAATALSGCVAAINERAMMRHMADELICTIDQSVVDEKEKLMPNGWLTKPYSPTFWQEYWNHRTYYLGNATFGRERALGYSGPSGRNFILYSLRQRQEEGLPNLVPEKRNASLVSELYQELQRNPRTSCEILAYPSPVCVLGPAQRPTALQFRRPCGVAPNNSFKPKPLRGSA